ncbi:MAG: hypothetical protein ACRDJN_19330, partial [Chloroflexota bacterium]
HETCTERVRQLTCRTNGRRPYAQLHFSHPSAGAQTSTWGDSGAEEGYVNWMAEAERACVGRVERMHSCTAN